VAGKDVALEKQWYPDPIGISGIPRLDDIKSSPVRPCEIGDQSAPWAVGPYRDNLGGIAQGSKIGIMPAIAPISDSRQADLKSVYLFDHLFLGRSHISADKKIGEIHGDLRSARFVPRQGCFCNPDSEQRRSALKEK
jgi:hypothetical protein